MYYVVLVARVKYFSWGAVETAAVQSLGPVLSQPTGLCSELAFSDTSRDVSLTRRGCAWPEWNLCLLPGFLPDTG